MISSETRENIIIKTEQAQEYATRALELCGKYVLSQDKKQLKKMGGYLGDIVNNIRSALNYAFKDYCEQRGFPKKKDGKTISTDFPYAFTKDNFENIKVISLISRFDPNLYNYLEEIQPYHPKQGFLGNIMKISNTDKHKVLVTVQNFDINFFDFVDSKIKEVNEIGRAHV